MRALRVSWTCLAIVAALPAPIVIYSTKADVAKGFATLSLGNPGDGVILLSVVVASMIWWLAILLIWGFGALILRPATRNRRRAF